MIFLKKYFQNQKGLQKLGTKHVPHAPKEDFQKKVKIFSFFKKGGLRGSKKENFEKIFSNQKGLQKLDIKNVPHAPKKIFNKVKVLSFFKKGGFRGSKNT